MKNNPAATRVTPSFWRDIQPCEHLLQIYGDDQRLLETLEPFVSTGLHDNGSVVVIATARHLHDLEVRLRRWIEVDRARWQGRYVALLAEETLSRILASGWPDEAQFNRVIGDVVARARSNGKSVRVFSELVGVLMARSRMDATVRLEQLWTAFCRREGLPLLCACPASVFPRGTEGIHQAVRDEHSALVTT
jgi:hypothetical protein